MCEYKLNAALGIEANDPTKNLTYYNQELDDCATGYATYVLEQVETARENCPDPVVPIEQRVDFSHWVEEGSGTADCIIIADGTLQIIDFKYGLGVLVGAKENPQMMCYALGALELFDDIYDISTVRMTIYQPHRDSLSTYELFKEDLLHWAEKILKPAANLAFAGDGNFLCDLSSLTQYHWKGKDCYEPIYQQNRPAMLLYSLHYQRYNQHCNLPIERYFNTLKNECTNLYDFQTEEDLYNVVEEFSYVTYNYLRPHAFNKYQPPCMIK